MYHTLDQDAVIRSAFELSPLPQSTVRLAAVVANEEIELEEVVQVIECDPSLTLKLLRVANSVYSSSSRHIGTVKEAVIRLGNGAILGVGIGSYVEGNMTAFIPGYSVMGTDLWRHSLAAALATECIRPYLRISVSPLAFTAALLHDIGKVVLGNYLDPDMCVLLKRARQEGKQQQFRAESELLSLNHAEIGGLVAQHWGLPEEIARGIAFHHDPTICDEPIASVVSFANYVANQVAPASCVAERRYCRAKEEYADEPGLVEMSTSDIARVIKQVRDRLGGIASTFK